MDKQDIEHFEGLLVKAIQSTKRENSGLISDMKTQIALLEEHFDDIKKVLEEIKEQTKRTNGSVISLKMWRSLTAGAIGIIVAIVMPLLTYIYINHTTQVEARLNKLER